MTVDRIELNHCVEINGAVRFDQLIFYRWKLTKISQDQVGHGYEVLGYLMIPPLIARAKLTPEEFQKRKSDARAWWIRTHPKATMIPEYNPPFTGGTWVPRKIGRFYHLQVLSGHIISKTFIETWTEYDPEYEARSLISIKDREDFLNERQGG